MKISFKEAPQIDPRLYSIVVEKSGITRLVRQLEEGNADAEERLAEALVAELEGIAGREMARLNGGHLDGLTLEPGVLAHDALLKLLKLPIAFENRRHLFAYATRIIVRAMIDYQRSRRVQQRGGHLLRVTLSGLGSTAVDVERFPEILDRLEALDARKAEVVKLRVFWGATVPQTAELLGVSPSSVERDWRFSRRWLAARFQAEAPGD